MNPVILINFHCPYEYAFECLRSVAAQKPLENPLIIVWDDGSPSDTEFKPKFLKQIERLQAEYIHHTPQMGQAYARLKLIRHYLAKDRDFSQDVVFFIDGDDKLTRRDAVLEVLDLYEKTDCLMSFGKMANLNLGEYATDFKATDARTAPWGCEHLRTVRGDVVANTNLEDSHFQVDGKWLESATDLALFFEFIEQNKVNGDRIGNIKVPNYLYRVHSGGNLGSHEKQQRALENERTVRQRKTDFYR